MTKKPTMPEPPKGRRWLREGEIIRVRDWYHPLRSDADHVCTICPGARTPRAFLHSRAIPRKTTRKQLK